MKRKLHLAVCAVLALVGVLQGASQAFPETPVPQKAYDAIVTLRVDGLVTAFPSGEGIQTRLLSRYEFAVAIYSAYQKLKMRADSYSTRVDELKTQIDEISTKAEDASRKHTAVSDEDLQALQAKLDSAKADLASAKYLDRDLAALMVLVPLFEQDLAALGVDVAAIKSDLHGVRGCLEPISCPGPPVSVGADLTLYGRAGQSRDGHTGADWNGKGVGHDTHLMSELGLNIGGYPLSDFHIDAGVAVGSLLGFEGGTMTQQWEQRSGGFGAVPGNSNVDVLLHHLEVKWDTAWLALPMLVRLGRIAVQSDNPYVLRRMDVDYYVDIPRWDDGNWYIDGAELSFGSTWGITVFGGKVNGRSATRSSDVSAMSLGDFTNLLNFGTASGALSVDTVVGADLGFKIGDAARLNVDYNLYCGAPASSGNTLPGGSGLSPFAYNRVAAMGAELRLRLLHDLDLKACYARSDFCYNVRNVYGSNNWAFDGMLHYERGSLGASAGYRYIGPFFAAPGDWGRIGFFNDPTGIKGFIGWMKYKFADALDAYASAEAYAGTGQRIGDAVIGLTERDKINRIQAGVGFDFASSCRLTLDWEGVFQQVDAARVGVVPSDKVDARFYTAKLSCSLGMNTSLSLGYQILDYNNKSGLAFYNVPGAKNLDGKAESGLVFTQLTVRY